MANPPVWFKACVFFEVLQLPYFFVAAYAFINKKNWIRTPSLIYGSHVTTVVTALLSEFLTSTRLDESQKLTLASFYLPYLIMPAILTGYMALAEKPFPDATTSKKLK
jgi:hypothetical protein